MPSLTNQNWIEVQIEVPPEAAELMAAAAFDVAEGVELRDAGTVIKAAPDRTLVIAHVAPEDREALLEVVHAAAETARAAGVTVDPLVLREREAHEDEWRDVWKQFFRTTPVGRRFVVRPSWDPVAIQDPRWVIDLDPGRAFGTGGHASTRLVISLAESVAEHLEGRGRASAPDAGASPGGAAGDVAGVSPPGIGHFLDLGCGSGILSIAAARLWPGARGLAVDIDADSVACALENLERNRITTVDTAVGSLEVLPAGQRFDLLMANIQADVLAALAPQLPQHLRPGAPIILSGLLTRDAEPVAAAFAAVGFSVEERRDEGEWAGLLARAPLAQPTGVDAAGRAIDQPAPQG